MKGLRVTTIDKEIKFEGGLGQVRSKNSFRRQSFTKYLRLTLVFMLDSVLREKFDSCFSSVFC